MEPNPVDQGPIDQSGFEVRFDWELEGPMILGPNAKVLRNASAVAAVAAAVGPPQSVRAFSVPSPSSTCWQLELTSHVCPKARTTMAMSKEHKDALAQGRLEARSIKAYLNSLAARKPGRPVTKDSLEKRLARVDSKLESEDDPLKRLDLLQTKGDIEQALGSAGTGSNPEELAAGFVAHAKSYSERKGINYTTWRQFGVPADLLRQAGIPETRRRA